MRPLVRILLSTFNGEQYLPALLSSILAQDYPALEILVRDDGSSDRTPELLDDFARDARVTVLKGANLGVAPSFFALVCEEPGEAAYFAYADQDDFWLPEKISRAVAVLETLKTGKPRLYAGRLKVTDRDLNVLRLSQPATRPLTLGNALIESPLTGCTMLFDAGARKLLASRPPEGIGVHDWWTYLVLSAFGKVVFDPEPFVLYRQHGQNVYGAGQGHVGKWLSRFSRMGSLRQAIRTQAGEFDRLWGGSLDAETRETLSLVLNSGSSVAARVKLALGNRIHRQSRMDDAVFRAMVLTTGL